MAGRSARLRGRAETGTAGVEPVAKEPRIGGVGLWELDFSVATLLTGAAIGLVPAVVTLDLAADGVTALTLVLLPVLLSALAPLLVSALPLDLVSLVPGRAAGSGTDEAAGDCASAPVASLSLARMPKAASRTKHRVPSTFPPAAAARSLSSRA